MRDKNIGFIGLGNVVSKIAYNILQNKTFYHRVAEIFSMIGDQKRSEKSLNKLKELVS